MRMTIKSAEGHSTPELTALFNRGFEKYVTPLSLTPEQVERWFRIDDVSLADSLVVQQGDVDVAVAFVVRRGRERRLAAMGVAPECRGQGIGTRIVEHMQRDGGPIELEVITTNVAGIKVYERAGFEALDRLTGHVISDPPGEARPLTEISFAEASERLARDATPGFPWMVSPENVGRMAPPAIALALGPATLVVQDPEVEPIVIKALAVSPEARGRGHGRQILRAAWARWPGRRWHVQSKSPSAWAGFFDAMGFERHPVEQLHMRWPGR